MALANECRYVEEFSFYKDVGMMTEAANAFSLMPTNTETEIS